MRKKTLWIFSEMVSILLQLLLRFRIIMMNPGSIPSDNLTEEVFTILIKFCQQFSTALHSLQLHLRRQHSWDPSSRNFPVSWGICDDVVDPPLRNPYFNTNVNLLDAATFTNQLINTRLVLRVWRWQWSTGTGLIMNAVSIVSQYLHLNTFHHIQLSYKNRFL